MSHNSFVKEHKNIATETHLSIWISKIYAQISPQKITRNIQGIFKKPSVHSYQTRFAKMENYFIYRVSSNIGKKSISYRGASLWNKVQQTLKAAPLSTFCNQLQEFVFSQY